MHIDERLANARTMPEVFWARVESTPDRIAHDVERGGRWHEVTYRQFGEDVRHAGCALAKMGVGLGDCVAIWGDTTAEWCTLDFAALCAGAHVAGVYQTSTPEQVAYLLNDAKVKVLCVDAPSRLDIALALRAEAPSLEKIVVCGGFEVPKQSDVVRFEDLLASGAAIHREEPGLLAARMAAVRPEDTALLIYTSGTTGVPKGVILSHANCVAEARCPSDFMQPDDTCIAFLPMSHVAEHAAQFFGRLYAGVRAAFCPDMTQVARVLQEKPPTLLVAVPRVYEKLHQKIMAKVAVSSPTKQRLFHWAVSVGSRMAQCKARGESPSPGLLVQHSVADKLVLAKIRAVLGGRVRIMVSGAAPMDTDLIEFYMALGVTFLEAYGLSETCGASHSNRPDAFRVGSVGKLYPGMEQKIAEDGEILMRGPLIFAGYLNKPEETAEVLDPDGWFHTGDIGEIDADGYLRITDRKKNLLITAGGKNVAPAGIEMRIKHDPLISQVVVLGDRKPYLVALITVNAEIAAAESLSQEAIEHRVKNAVDEANTHLARYEQIKRYAIIDREFTIESGELTPSMKIKRNVVMANYAHLITEMYASGEEGAVLRGVPAPAEA